MVDLSRPVRCGESDIVDSVVDIFVQADLGNDFDEHFADNTFPPGRFYNPNYDGKRDYPPKVLEKAGQKVHIMCHEDSEWKI